MAPPLFATRPVTDHPTLSWTDAETATAHTARWRSEAGTPPPKRVTVADDRITADTAYRQACEGIAILWRGDFQNARQLLQAMSRRADRKPPKAATSPSTRSISIARPNRSAPARSACC